MRPGKLVSSIPSATWNISCKTEKEMEIMQPHFFIEIRPFWYIIKFGQQRQGSKLFIDFFFRNFDGELCCVFFPANITNKNLYTTKRKTDFPKGFPDEEMDTK